MMDCKKCGKQIPDDSVFCPFCGEAMELLDSIAITEDITEIQETDNGTQNSESITDAEPKETEPGTKEFPAKIEKPHKRATFAAIILAVLVGALAGLNIFQYHNNNLKLQTITTEKEALSSENAELKDSNAKLEEQKNKAITERDTAKKEKEKAISNSQQYRIASTRYNGIKTWIEKHCKDFHASNSYYAASNVIAVRVGETVNLEIVYSGNRNLWERTTNSNCKVDWNMGWSNNRTSEKIEGVSEGTSEIIFSLGDSNKADAKESFRVLVIVV